MVTACSLMSASLPGASDVGAFAPGRATLARMTLTPARQRNAVSEGFALGLVMCDLARIPNNRAAVGLAFASAWRAWPHQQHFPQVGTDLSKGMSPLLVAVHAEQGRQTWRLYWERVGAEWVVRARDGGGQVDSDEVAATIDGDLPVATWADLARAFLDRLGD